MLSPPVATSPELSPPFTSCLPRTSAPAIMPLASLRVRPLPRRSSTVSPSTLFFTLETVPPLRVTVPSSFSMPDSLPVISPSLTVSAPELLTMPFVPLITAPSFTVAVPELSSPFPVLPLRTALLTVSVPLFVTAVLPLIAAPSSSVSLPFTATALPERFFIMLLSAPLMAALPEMSRIELSDLFP